MQKDLCFPHGGGVENDCALLTTDDGSKNDVLVVKT